MRYLKLFEDRSDLDYYKISHSEWSDLVRDRIDYSDVEIKSIESILGRTQLISYTSDSLKMMYGRGRYRYISIAVLPDEWYVISDGMGWYYKCDQIRGLLGCLKAIIVSHQDI